MKLLSIFPATLILSLGITSCGLLGDLNISDLIDLYEDALSEGAEFDFGEHADEQNGNDEIDLDLISHHGPNIQVWLTDNETDAYANVFVVIEDVEIHSSSESDEDRDADENVDENNDGLSDGAVNAQESGTENDSNELEITSDEEEGDDSLEEIQDSDACNPNEGGWTTVVENAGVFDLLQLRDGVLAALGDAYLCPGAHYQQIRFDVDEAWVVTHDGEIKPLEIASDTIKINLGLWVEEGVGYKVILDFDALQSIVENDNGDIHLKPMVHAEIEEIELEPILETEVDEEELDFF